MHQLEPAAPAESGTNLTARLAAAERALAARDKTIQALITREKDRTAKRPSAFGVMEDNAALQEVVARKTLELEAQNRKLEHTTSTLRQSEERMRLQTAALESAANGVAITDRKGTLQWVNRAFTLLTGYSADEAIGQNPRVLKSGQHPGSFCDQMWETISQGRVWKGEIINRHKSGRLYHEEMTITPVCDASGATTHFIAIKQDISERKRAEEQLRLLSSAVEQSQESIIITDADLDLPGPRILFVNPSFTRMTGYTAEEVMGKTPRILQGPRTDKTVLSQLRQNLERGEAFEGEVINYRKDGTEFNLEWQIVPIRDASGKITHYVAIQRDITERKRVQAELENIHKQLVDASRRGGMAEIATNVLHNVGNVLNSVNISASMVVERVKKSRASNLTRVTALLQEHAHDLGDFITSDPKGKHLPIYLAQLSEQLLADQAAMVVELDSLRQNVEHIKEIVAMQQSYATFGGVKEVINVVDLVEDSLRMNEGALNRHRVAVVREFEAVPPLNIEKHKLLQILVNLLRNAKHACQESEGADKRVTVRVTNGAGRIKISVQDNGVGIPAENLTRIFNHGFTTRKDGHGFGLHSGALAAKDMGGSLTAHSDGLGQGAVFTLELPLPAAGETHE